MAKIIITVALLLAMVALASAYTTTITTTVVEEDNPRGRGSQQKCEDQFREQQELSHCQMWLQQRSRSPYEAEESLRMVVNPQQQQHEKQCCQQLDNMDEECRCEGIREMVKMQQRQGQMEQQKMQRMAQMAMDLPRQCRMEPQQCQIRAVWF